MNKLTKGGGTDGRTEERANEWTNGRTEWRTDEKKGLQRNQNYSLSMRMDITGTWSAEVHNNFTFWDVVRCIDQFLKTKSNSGLISLGQNCRSWSFFLQTNRWIHFYLVVGLKFFSTYVAELVYQFLSFACCVFKAELAVFTKCSS